MSTDTKAHPKILLIEGKDDKHVVEHLWEQNYGGDQPFHVQDKEGLDLLLKSLVVEIKAR